MKDFDGWNKEKKGMHEEKVRPFFHEREIWFTSLGVNIGFEQDGRGEQFMRPVVVVKKFNNEVMWGVPLTKNTKKSKYYFQFSFSNSGVSTVILSQIRLIDSKRLQYKVGDIKESDFVELKKKIIQLLV